MVFIFLNVKFEDIGLFLIGLFNAAIIFLEYKNSKYRNKIDLYDKRYDIYNRLKNIISITIQGNKEKMGFDFVSECEIVSRNSKFLFDEVLSSEISEIIENCQEQSQFYEEYRNPNSTSQDRKNKLGDTHQKRMKYFDDRMKNLESLFFKVMKLDK